MANDEAVNENDPDAIAANPPVKAIDPKQHFRVGANDGKWLEYDERGVPTKNIKKKKPTKKEKDGLETEFLDAKKKYQQYLKDVEEWEQKKLDAENSLEGTDRLRWAMRQVNVKNCEDKNTPLLVDRLEDLFEVMGWDQLTKKEVTVVKKAARDPDVGGDNLDLETLRRYTKEIMPVKLLEERLKADIVEDVKVEDVYSPRTWRGKLDGSKQEKKSGGKSPRGSKSPRGGASPRGGNKGSTSPRGKTGDKKASQKTVSMDKSPSGSSPKSPRGGGGGGGGAKSPRGGSTKSKKK